MRLFTKIKDTSALAVQKAKDFLPKRDKQKQSEDVAAADKKEAKQFEKFKHGTILFFSRIDYNAAIAKLSFLRYIDPRLAIAILLIEKIKSAFDRYNESKAQDKELKLSEQLLAIGKEFRIGDVIDVLLPFSKKIPYGKPIIMGLRILSAFTSSKK